MAVKRAPAFQFYPSDFLSSQRQAAMSATEAGIYIRLLCHCWLEGSLPADSPSLARLAAVDSHVFAEVEITIRNAFKIRKKDGRLFHSRLDHEYRKQLIFRKMQQQKGFASARARQHRSNRGLTVVQPEVNSSSSSSSSEERSKKNQLIRDAGEDVNQRAIQEMQERRKHAPRGRL